MSLAMVFLDAGPLSEVVRRPGQNPEGDACRAWLDRIAAAGILVCVAEITDYELRRELLRSARTTSLGRLDRLVGVPGRYVPLSTTAMRAAAELWAEARRAGAPTAAPGALDADVILAAQVRCQAAALGIAPQEVIVATSNVGHLSRFVSADLWRRISSHT